MQWGEEETVVFDLDTFDFSDDGSNELSPDSPQFDDTCRRVIDGLMTCMGDI